MKAPRPTLLVLFCAAALLCGTVLSAAADGPREGPRDRMRAAHDRWQERWDQMDAAKRDRALDQAERHHLFGRFTYTPDAAGATVTGKHTSFHLVPATGVLHNYAVQDAKGGGTFFSAITPAPFHLEGTPKPTGSVLHVQGETLTIQAHNNPTGALRHRADAATTVTFTLAPNATVGTTTEREVRINLPGLHGHILSSGNASIQRSSDDRTVTVNLAAGESALFRAHPPGVDAAVLHAQNRAFTARALGAVLRIVDGGGQALEDGDDGGVHAETRAIGAGRLTLNVSSDDPAGKVVYLTVDNATLDPAHAARFQVALDHLALSCTSTVDQVTDASGAAQPLCAIATDPASGGTVIAVRFPHFSAYTLAIVDATPSSPASPGTGAAGSGSGSASTPGLELPLLAFALLGVALAGRKR